MENTESESCKWEGTSRGLWFNPTFKTGESIFSTLTRIKQLQIPLRSSNISSSPGWMDPVLNLSSCITCFSPQPLCWPLLWLTSVGPGLLCTDEPHTRPSTPDVISELRNKEEGRITLPELLAILLPVQPRMLLASFAARECCWLIFSFLSPRSFHPQMQLMIFLLT